MEKINKSNEEWKKILTKEQFHVLREKGTEKAFTGKLLNNKEKGIYLCAACGKKLFSSESKYDSGTGWPSFWEALQESVEIQKGILAKLTGAEVTCARCGSHLGHVFSDGPKPTGKRYCMNSVALKFKKA